MTSLHFFTTYLSLKALLSLGPSAMRCGVARRSCRSAPSCRRCRQLLRLDTVRSLREAFLTAAWDHHPDSFRATKDGFAELKSCYEQLRACCGKIDEGAS